MQALRDALDALASKIEGLKGEDLAQNEAFVSGVLHTTQLALRTHQKEKLEALRNSVLNIAIGRAPGEDLQQIFLDHIDTLTTWHLRILKFFQAPQQHSPNTSFHVGAPANVLEATFTELHGRRNFYDQIVKDLYAKGLMSLESLHVMMTVGGMYEKRTTPLGDQFLAFIAAPPELTA